MMHSIPTIIKPTIAKLRALLTIVPVEIRISHNCFTEYIHRRMIYKDLTGIIKELTSHV